MPSQRQFDKTYSPDDAIGVALEHVSYLRRLGIGIRQALAAINVQANPADGWDAVVWAYAVAYEGERRAYV